MIDKERQMANVACAMSSCEFQEREDGIPKSRCTKIIIRLVAYPLYLELAKKFSGTVRCLEYEKFDGEIIKEQ